MQKRAFLPHSIMIQNVMSTTILAVPLSGYATRPVEISGSANLETETIAHTRVNRYRGTLIPVRSEGRSGCLQE